jgi:hypothetical protein
MAAASHSRRCWWHAALARWVCRDHAVRAPW